MEVPKERHSGGKLLGKPLPKGTAIFSVHYRRWKALKEVRLSELGKNLRKYTPRLNGLTE